MYNIIETASVSFKNVPTVNALLKGKPKILLSVIY